MNAREFRAMAVRCRDMQRGGRKAEVREQLRQWAIEFDTEADVLETTAKYGEAVGDKQD